MVHPLVQARTTAQALDAAGQFQATLAAVSGNSVQILRGGQTVADATFYLCLAGIVAGQSLLVGDQVLLLQFGSSVVCIGRADA